MMSMLIRARPVSVRPTSAIVFWLGYIALAALMLTCYVAVFVHGAGMGVDYACFRAASLLLGHGGNPYDFGQLWRLENALYNAPWRLSPASPAYYGLDRYYNPPLFATALTPLARLPFAQGYIVYAVIVAGLAIAGAWLTLSALGWTRRRIPAIAITAASPCVFLTVWNGQQSTLLLFALGAALYALRRRHAEIAGAVIALGWVKPHLLIPIALAAPLLLSPRVAWRWYAGFGLSTACGTFLTIATSGAASMIAWLHTLFGYTGYVDAIQTYLPSIPGMILVLAPHPWNKVAAVAVMALGVGVMIVVLGRARRLRRPPLVTIGLLMAAWLVFTPFAHANDDVLLLPALAIAWGRDGADGARALPRLALWACSILPLAFLLPGPWKLLGTLPPVLVLAAAIVEGRRSEVESDRGRDVG